MPRLSRSDRKKLLVLVAAGALTVIVVSVALLGDLSVDGRSTRGTMGGAAAMEAGEASFAWYEAALNRPAGTLSGEFEASVTVQSPQAHQEARFELYFSRDPEFSADEDCMVQARSEPVPSGRAIAVQFRALAYEAACVDAGLWHAAVLVVETGQWISLDQTVEIAAGAAELEFAGTARELGWHEPLSVAVDVYRQATEVGLTGLLNHPASVWLQSGDRLCMAQIDPITLPRDPERRAPGTWVATRIELVVDPDRVQQIDSDSGLAELAALGRTDVSPGGRCRLDEGAWQVAVGPVSPGRFTTGAVTIHAPPVWIDTAPVKLTLASGDATSIEVRAFNPSRSALGWTAAAADLVADDWLKGTSDQRLTGRDSTSILLTVSAVDLQPGFYDGSFRITAVDYYGTEVLVPVELTVQQGRGIAGGDDPELPGQFEISNYPNPFRGRTTFRIQLREAGQIRLAVFDVSGREVRQVADEWMSDGVHEIPFDANDLPSGTYLARIVTGSGALTRTITLVN